MELNALVAPAKTAVLTMELQRGICGESALYRQLREAVTAAGVEENTARLLNAARAAGATVGHCVFTMTPSREGTRMDLPLMSAARKDPNYLLQGSEQAQVLPMLGPHPSDLISERHVSVTPFTGSDLHQQLTTRGVETVVICGVSLNVGVPGMTIEAVNLGYSVVVARDCVAGFPEEYARGVLVNMLPSMSTVSDSQSIIDCWTSR